MEFGSVLRTLVEAAGPAAASALWQGSVVAAGLEICLRLTRRASAADRFRAWGAGFAVVAALALLPLIGSMPAASAASAPARALVSVDPRWGWGIAAVWLAASVWRAVELAFHALKTRRMWRRAVVVASRTGFEICTTRDLDRPGVIGFWRPRILIPEWLMGRLSADELEQVVLHEAEHLRRGDDWTNLGQKIALVVFPLNPGLAWIDSRLNRERELACDDGVVRATGRPRVYAACLANLAERSLKYRLGALSLGAWRKRSELAGRVHRLLKTRPGLSPVAAKVLFGAVACGLAFAAVELARAPQLVSFVARPVVAQLSAPNYHEVKAVAETAALKSAPKVVRAHADVAPQSGSTADVVIPETSRQNGGENAAQKPAEQWVMVAVADHMLALNRNGQVVADFDLNPADGDWPDAAPAAQKNMQPMILRLRIAGPQLPVVISDFELPDIDLEPLPAPVQTPGEWLIYEL